MLAFLVGYYNTFIILHEESDLVRRKFYNNMKFILSVDQDISRVSKANERDILFNTRNKFHISNIHACMYIVLFTI